MSEPLLERLTRFTPDAGTLNRDALLYDAGRRSARPNRGLIALAAALAGSQALCLALLLVHPTPTATHQGSSTAFVTPSSAGVEPPTAQAPASPGVWSVRQGLRDPEPEDGSTSASAVTIVDGGSPWRALGPPPASILN